METLSAAAIEAQLHTRRFGHPLRVVAETDSTNRLAREWAAAGAPEGAAVTADRQTAGRGRRGRAFFSPPGGMYLSVVLRPAAGIDPGWITSCAAVAVARAIERFAEFSVQIKWVNDLLIHGKKVCGIRSRGRCGMRCWGSESTEGRRNFRRRSGRSPPRWRMRAARWNGSGSSLRCWRSGRAPMPIWRTALFWRRAAGGRRCWDDP